MKKGKSNKKNKQQYTIYIMILVIAFICIFLSENYLMKSFSQKMITIYNSKNNIQSEMLISPSGYKLNGIFNKKFKEIDEKRITENESEYFNVEQGDGFNIKSESVRGENPKDINTVKIFGYNENFEYMEFTKDMDDENIILFAPMEIGKYMVILDIEYNNQDTLTYKFFINVKEKNEEKVINDDIESMSYIDLDKNESISLDKNVIDNLEYYMNNSLVVDNNIKFTELPFKILEVTDSNNTINTLDIYNKEHTIYIYKENINKLYCINDSLYDDFLNYINTL